MRYTLIIILFCTATSLFAQKTLFIGNSLSYSNDLPRIVETIGKAYDKDISTECVCLPNYGLEDHWNDGLIQEKISKGEFDYVLFQQGPSSQANGRASLFDLGGKISTLSKTSGVKPGYFMVWPSVQYYHTFASVIKNHKEAAEANEAMVIPVGEVWQRYRQTSSKSDLYGPDQFHPSPAGSFLAALAIVKAMHPEIDLSDLKHNGFKAFIASKKDFKLIIDLVINN